MNKFIAVIFAIILLPIILAFWIISAVLEIVAWVIVAALMVPFWIVAAITGTAQRISAPWDLKTVRNPKDWAIWGKISGRSKSKSYKAKEDK